MKKVNPIVVIKLIILSMFLYILINQPQILINTYDYVTNSLINYVRNNSIQTNIISLLVILTIYVMIKVSLEKTFYYFKLKYTNLKKNTHSKGKAKFQEINDMKLNYKLVDIDDNYTSGTLIAQYKQLNPRIPLFKQKYKSHYEVKKKLIKEDTLHGDDLNNKEQVKLLKKLEMSNDKKFKEIYYKTFYYAKNVAFLDLNPINTLIVATTRAGKTQTLILPFINLLANVKKFSEKQTMIISDPKGEIFNNTANDLKANGFETLVLNLKEHEYSNSYNPLEIINEKHCEYLNKHLNEQKSKIIDFKNSILDEKIIRKFTDDEDIIKKIDEVLNLNDNEFLIELEKLCINFGNNEVGTYIRQNIEKYQFGFNKLEILNNTKVLLSEIKTKANSASNIEMIDETIHEITEENLEEQMRQFFGRLLVDEEVKNKYKMYYEQIYIKELDKVSFGIAESELTKLANMLITDMSSERQWTGGARGILTAYIKIVWEKCLMYNKLDKAFNLYSTMTEITFGGEMIDEKTSRMQQELSFRKKNHYAKLQHPNSYFGKTYNSFLVNLKTDLVVFTDENIGRLTSRQEFDFHKIAKGNKPYAIYLITPDYDSTYNFIVSTFISQLYTVLVEDAELKYGGKLPRKVHFILDEFANIPKIEQLTNKLTVCLGRGIQFMMVVQNINQLKSVYGDDDYITILDNTHNKQFLLAGTYDTNEWFSKQLGTYTILSESITGKEYDEMTKTVSEDSKQLVDPYDLNLNPLGQMYMATVKNDPVKAKLRPAFKYLENNETTIKEYFKNKERAYLKLNINEMTV